MPDFIGDIELERSCGKPLYMQLYEQLKYMIKDGKLQPGHKLPPIRELAGMLGVNSVTVVKAYKRLETDGMVFSKTGSGTYVSSDTAIASMHEYTLPSHDVIDFANFTPSPQLFPVEHFKALINEVLERDGGMAFEYQDSRGYPPLRAALVEYAATMDIEAHQDDIQVISGAQQGIDILSKALLDFGDTVVMESPSYTGAIAAFRSRNVRIAEVPMNEDGLDIRILERRVREDNPRLIYVMTDFHNPTGVSYSLQKRKQLLNIARRYDILIVEDDYLSELNFSGNKQPLLKSMDDDQRVIYIKSFSKILMPGLRLGFMVLPRRDDIYRRVLDAKHASDISTSGLMQRVLELYLNRGLWYEHISIIYGEYKRRYEHMLQALDRYMPKQIKYHVPSGGLHIWLLLPEGCCDRELYGYAVDAGVIFAPGSAFYPRADKSRYLKISFASTDEKQIDIGIKRLSQAITAYLSDKYKKNNDRYTPLL